MADSFKQMPEASVQLIMKYEGKEYALGFLFNDCGLDSKDFENMLSMLKASLLFRRDALLKKSGRRKNAKRIASSA
jgi:hypothetical protein